MTSPLHPPYLRFLVTFGEKLGDFEQMVDSRRENFRPKNVLELCELVIGIGGGGVVAIVTNIALPGRFFSGVLCSWVPQSLVYEGGIGSGL